MTSRFFTCVLALLRFCLSSGSYAPQTLPDIGDAEFIEECVREHNRFRSEVSPQASNMLYMSWDPDLAKTAKAWAKRCQFMHNTHLKEPGQTHPRFTSVGENIWTGSLSIFSVQGAINSWYKEVNYYSYTDNSCRRVCGHYTQVGTELLHLNQELALPFGHRNSRFLSKIQRTKCYRLGSKLQGWLCCPLLSHGAVLLGNQCSTLHLQLRAGRELRQAPLRDGSSVQQMQGRSVCQQAVSKHRA
ncbi:glioma pathogenesis-related protein 1-like isoform X2 [Oxyura jamaicensis]|uniref:glioma pathogenesis-related protein 1-like isoform X2 n=1 Tax=Oxyura jamaicensis TaxID=8884 RepID=UPI0015A71EAC|nr:glioma pathogenesis-related protein 1-like isoform X2 [Oxyura jamaicensis]